jgi:hypothetical protein
VKTFEQKFEKAKRKYQTEFVNGELRYKNSAGMDITILERTDRISGYSKKISFNGETIINNENLITKEKKVFNETDMISLFKAYEKNLNIIFYLKLYQEKLRQEFPSQENEEENTKISEYLKSNNFNVICEKLNTMFHVSKNTLNSYLSKIENFLAGSDVPMNFDGAFESSHHFSLIEDNNNDLLKNIGEFFETKKQNLLNQNPDAQNILEQEHNLTSIQIKNIYKDVYLGAYETILEENIEKVFPKAPTPEQQNHLRKHDAKLQTKNLSFKEAVGKLSDEKKSSIIFSSSKQKPVLPQQKRSNKKSENHTLVNYIKSDRGINYIYFDTRAISKESIEDL